MKCQLTLNKMKNASDKTSEGLMLAKGTVPVPTDLLDRVMPTLRDTELRVLLVVVRQTLGWQVGKDPYLRKERDWLTQSQLMRRSGRASGAVAHAIDVLVQRNLIDVLDETERLLLTAAERRRHLGRMYFRLHQFGVSGDQKLVEAESKHAKPHTTKNTVYKNKQVLKVNVDNSGEKPVTIRGIGWTRATDSFRRHDTSAH